MENLRIPIKNRTIEIPNKIWHNLDFAKFSNFKIIFVNQKPLLEPEEKKAIKIKKSRNYVLPNNDLSATAYLKTFRKFHWGKHTNEISQTLKKISCLPKNKRPKLFQ